MAWPGWDPASIRRNQLKALATTGRRSSKYHNVAYLVLPDLTLRPMDDTPVWPGALPFASKREAERYVVLRIEQQGGHITDLQLQPSFDLTVLTPDNVTAKVGAYVADFQYLRDGRLVIEDAKGVRPPLYLWKRKHFELQYAQRVLET